MQYISIDAFAPQHVMRVVRSLETGNIPIEQYNTPLFYILGNMAVNIFNIDPPKLMFFPLQAIPFMMVLYAFLRMISGRPLIAAGIVSVHFLSGLTGTSTLYFWPHGMGHILFLTLLISVINLTTKKYINSNMGFGLMIVPIAIAFTIPWFSYNLWIIMVLTLGALTVTAAFVRDSVFNLSQIPQIAFIAIISVLGYVSLSKFVFRVATPFLLREEEFSPISKFLAGWFSGSDLPSELNNIYFSRPSLMTQLAVFRYIIFLIVIITVVFGIYHRIFRSKCQLSAFEWIIHSLMVGFGGFMGLRMLVGAVPIGWLYWAGIFAIALLARQIYAADMRKINDYRHKLAVIAVTCLLIQTPLFYTAAIFNDATPKTNGFDNMETASGFLDEYGTGDIVRTSIFSTYLLQLYWENMGSEYDNSQILSTDEVIRLLSGGEFSSGYTLLNYDLHAVNLLNWVTLESWGKSSHKLTSNANISKIYSNKEIIVYK